MATQNEGPNFSGVAAAAFDKFALVMLDTNGKFAKTTGVAGEDINVLATAQEAASAADEVKELRALNCVASAKVVAAVNNITVGQTLYTAASGRASNASTSGTAVGIAKQASSAAGDIIEMFPRPSRDDADVT